MLMCSKGTERMFPIPECCLRQEVRRIDLEKGTIENQYNCPKILFPKQTKEPKPV